MLPKTFDSQKNISIKVLPCRKICVILLFKEKGKQMIQERTYSNELETPAMQEVFLNVPVSDWALLRELIRKFGWQSETREQLIDRFCNSRPQQPSLTDEEILEEVNAVRYHK